MNVGGDQLLQRAGEVVDRPFRVMQLFQPEQADAEGPEIRWFVALQRHAGGGLQAEGEELLAVLDIGVGGVADDDAGLSGEQLVDLFAWDEATFLRMTEGGPIRRIGHERWLRNVAVSLGNALAKTHSANVRAALHTRAAHESALVREHVQWALENENIE